jgi:hypothetical protein
VGYSTHFCGCKHPKIENLSYAKWDEDKKIIINNWICSSCLAHLYGPEGQEKFYTKAEWDKWVE